MALAMLISGLLGTRLGEKRTMLLGLGVVVVFATTSGLSPSIGILALFRGGWGLGNAFFTSTALAILVGLSTGGMGPAITLYEAALGLGIASGPLLGGALGGISWRDPFFGTARLMGIAFLATWRLVKEPPGRERARAARDIFRARGNRPVWSGTPKVAGGPVSQQVSSASLLRYPCSSSGRFPRVPISPSMSPHSSCPSRFSLRHSPWRGSGDHSFRLPTAWSATSRPWSPVSAS